MSILYLRSILLGPCCHRRTASAWRRRKIHSSKCRSCRLGSSVKLLSFTPNLRDGDDPWCLKKWGLTLW